jgi:AcrR family transcriptional regulator
MPKNRPEHQKAAPPVPLTRDRIVRAAVGVADTGGFHSLSMRNLADRLGTAPMSLYRHVANKEDLLDGMIDIVFGEVAFRSEGDWRSAMRQRAVSMHEALRRHPWAIGEMESRRRAGPENLRYHNDTMACLREDAGFSFPMAVHAYSVMDSYIYGFAQLEKTLPSDIPAEAEVRHDAVLDANPEYAEKFPYLVQIPLELRKINYDYSQEFEFGLNLILDAIQRIRERESPSTPTRGARRTTR